MRRLTMLMLPSTRWRPSWDSHIPGCGPDPTRIFELLATDYGIDTTLMDPMGLPWNPFAQSHQLFCGIDPARALRILLTQRSVDIVLACFEPGAAALLALRRLAAFRAAIAVIDIGLTEDWAVRERVLDFIIPRADALYPLGSNQADYISQRWRTNAEVRFIPQHVDAEFYQPVPPTAGGPVLSVGDDHGRDYSTLLAAMEGLPAKLVLKSRLVSADQARPSVCVIGERLAGPDYRALFQQACFVVVPLRPMLTASGVGTVLEAMAMGKALVVSDSPGIRDYVTHDETALVVPCGDVAAHRTAITRLLQEPETRSRLGNGARAFVEQHCSFPSHVAKLGPALRDLAERRAVR